MSQTLKENLNSPVKASSKKHKSSKKKDLSTNNSTDDDGHGENFEVVELSLTQRNREESRENISQNELSNNCQNDVLEISQNNSDSVKSIFNVEDLTFDDEIYTLQCPDNFHKKDLCNRIIDLTNLKTTLTSNNEVFQVQLLDSDKEFVTLAVPDSERKRGSLLMLPLEGHIVIYKDIHAPAYEPMGDDYIKPPVVFPSDIKVRHPLLGIDWKAHVDLANAAYNKNSSHKKKIKVIKRERTRDPDEMSTVGSNLPLPKRRKNESAVI